jgi:hypothetical protein
MLHYNRAVRSQLRQFLAVTMACLALGACSRTSSQPPTDHPPSSSQPVVTPSTATREPTLREVTIPAGTLLHLRLDTLVASDTSRAEDPVQASVARPVLVDGVEAVPAGSAVKGVVTQARRSGKVKGRAEVALRFDALAVSGGPDQPVQTRTVAVQAPSTRRNDALKIGAPAAGGAILGAILGGKKGAVIGGAVGGGAGTAVVLSTRGKEVRLAPGTALTVKLLEPVTVRVARDR